MPDQDEKTQEMVLPLEKCSGDLPGCGSRVRYSELTDMNNTHWHLSSLMPVLRYPPGSATTGGDG